MPAVMMEMGLASNTNTTARLLTARGMEEKTT
jgi:hypothetical protein